MAIKGLAFVISAGLVLSGCISQTQFGVRDDVAGTQIEELNEASSLRQALNYHGLSNLLIKRLDTFRSNSYAISRARNELSDLYTFQLLDIESAISLDEAILREPIPEADSVGNFVPKHLVANQRILADRANLDEYITVSATKLRGRAEDRLATNRALLEGREPSRGGNYDVDFLKTHLQSVKGDIASTPIGSADRLRVLSRLVRAEYELLRRNLLIDDTASQYIATNELPLNRIDLSEIDYLSLAKYFTLIFKRTGDIRFAEYSLETVYRPYQNIRNPDARWKYNKLINDYITTLIDANFKGNRFDEMLYYVSLNKSRMLLEERLTFGGAQGAKTKISDLLNDDGIPRTSFGLPEKAWFKGKLAATSQFLDFYVGGSYVPESKVAVSKMSLAERSVMPLNSRNAVRAGSNAPADTFKDDALYVTRIENGRVHAIKLDKSESDELHRQMNQSYEEISSDKTSKVGKVTEVNAFQRLKVRIKVTGDIATVSPDKWVSRQPLDFHLGTKTVRSVNFFTTSGATGKLSGLRVAGFFNPTLSDPDLSWFLDGAEREAEKIKGLIPTASIIRGDAARTDSLDTAATSNVLHLSMHGYFNAADPARSKLFFAGSRRDDSTGDPAALYAIDMARFDALRNRDLIFAAACQTGLSAADRNNESELIGILRPLTANRNRNVILSLWSVSDIATGEFVNAFYQKLASSQNITTSFHFAQDQLRAKYPHPYYWAAFYLSQTQ